MWGNLLLKNDISRNNDFYEKYELDRNRYFPYPELSEYLILMG